MLRVENPAVVHALALLIGEVVEVATTAATAVKIVAGASAVEVEVGWRNRKRR